MMKDLLLDDEDKQHIQGQYAWIPCSEAENDHYVGIQQNYDFDEDHHDYFRPHGLFCAILSNGPPIGWLIRLFELNVAYNNSQESLTFMLQFNTLLSYFNDYKLHVSPSSTPSTPMKGGSN